MNLIPIYLVIVNAGGNINACDVFFDKDIAFIEAISRGMKLTRSEYIRKNPSKQVDEKGQSYWTILDINTHSIVIMERIINKDSLTTLNVPLNGDSEISKTLPMCNGPVGPTRSVYDIIRGATGSVHHSFSPTKGYVVMQCKNGIVAPVIVLNKQAEDKVKPDTLADLIDDPFAPELPAGWDINNKPITIGQFLKDPQSYKDLEEVSENHLFALVIARLNKRANYKGFILPHNTFGYISSLIKDEVIDELKERTSLGWEIRDTEILELKKFIDEQVFKAFP